MRGSQRVGHDSAATPEESAEVRKESLRGDEISEFRHLRALNSSGKGIRRIWHDIREQSWDHWAESCGSRFQLSMVRNNFQNRNGLPHEGESSPALKVCQLRYSEPLSRGDLLGLRAEPRGL